jgi:hypothetical protein
MLSAVRRLTLRDTKNHLHTILEKLQRPRTICYTFDDELFYMALVVLAKLHTNLDHRILSSQFVCGFCSQSLATTRAREPLPDDKLVTRGASLLALTVPAFSHLNLRNRQLFANAFTRQNGFTNLSRDGIK